MSKQISLSEWETKLQKVQVSQDDLNKLVMNYLVIEGFKDAAEQFQLETGIQKVDLSSIQHRMEIRNAIQQGNIEHAIEQVNDLDPEILDTHPKLFFHLQQQRLIELIRKGSIEEAILFAQEELAPRGEEHPEFLEELEKTMSLLAFESRQSPVGDLLDHAQRQKIASELNGAILSSQCQEKDPKLPSMLKMLVWAQNQLEEKISFPKITKLDTAEFDSLKA